MFFTTHKKPTGQILPLGSAPINLQENYALMPYILICYGQKMRKTATQYPQAALGETVSANIVRQRS